MLLVIRTSIPYSAIAETADFAFPLPDSRIVVKALIGDLPLTLRASLTTSWLRRVPVLRCEVRFLGLPIVKQIPYLKLLDDIQPLVYRFSHVLTST